MKAHSVVLILCCISTAGQAPKTVQPSQSADKTISIKSNPDAHVSEQELVKLFAKTCPNYRFVGDADKSDYTLATAVKSEDGSGHAIAIYDKAGMIIRWTTSRLSTAVSEICYALDTATVIEVVDMENFMQTEDARNAPSRPGVAGISDAIHGRRNTHTDNTTLNVIANGEHALLDCYEHHKGCTTMSPGKYYGEVDGNSIWIDYEMPISHEPKRVHYVIAGGW
jgi:hypothetical protein